jgi:hypothetical protein
VVTPGSINALKTSETGFLTNICVSTVGIFLDVIVIFTFFQPFLTAHFAYAF